MHGKPIDFDLLYALSVGVVVGFSVAAVLCATVVAP